MQDIIYVIDISPYKDIIDALAWDIEYFYNRTVDSRNVIWTSRMRTRIILAVFHEEFIKHSQCQFCAIFVVAREITMAQWDVSLSQAS